MTWDIFGGFGGVFVFIYFLVDILGSDFSFRVCRVEGIKLSFASAWSFFLLDFYGIFQDGMEMNRSDLSKEYAGRGGKKYEGSLMERLLII